MVKIADKQLTFQDFGSHLLKSQRNTQTQVPFKQVILNEYNNFLTNGLMQYQEDHLEIENPDFANILSEYRDGLLLFDLMESTIWNASKTDSLAVQTYYNEHKNDYVWPDRIDAVAVYSTDQSMLNKVSKLLKDGIDIEDIKNKFNTKDTVNVIFTVGVMDAKNQALPENFQFKKGVSKIYNHNNSYVVVQVKDIFPSSLKSFDACKGNVISDYQTYKESNWLVELKNKYNVVINQEALNHVRTIINNQ